MVFCQSCGARNTEDSRFCNMCGGRIAAPGEPGGPIGETSGAGGAVPGGGSTTGGSRVSLEAIGVRSGRRTWAILGGAGLALFALGAGGMFVVMRPGEAPPAAAVDGGSTEEEEEPIEVGDPVPADEEVPEGVDFVPGAPRVTKRASTTPARPRATGGTASSGGSSGSTTSGSATGGSTTGGSATGGSATGGSASGGSATGGAASGGAASGGAASGGAATGGAATGGAASGGSATGGSGGSTAPATGGTGTVDWERAGAVPVEDEEDALMDAYAAHVRRYIREYHVRRAQMCFDHESRVDQQAVRGTIVIGFTIRGSGEVDGATVVRNTTGRDALASCLQRQVAEWRLPRPPEGVDSLPMQMPFSR